MDGDKVVSPAVSINYGNFLQVTFDFIIIAFSIFMLVKGINALNKKEEEHRQLRLLLQPIYSCLPRYVIC